MSRKRALHSTLFGGRPRRRVPAADPASRIGVLAGLGIHGYDAVEDGFLTGLVLGEPILLVGDIGSAKTMLAERTAAALGMRFWAYDASKAVFEDVVGFPDPRAMQEGRVDYLQAPPTLWGKDFILVDELSRAPLGMQNKWLEIIQSRRLMGMALPELQMIVAAMNPTGMGGTMPLDPALAGRFTFILRVPEVHDLREEDRRKVIRSLPPGYALRRGVAPSSRAGQGEGSPAQDLEALLERARQNFHWAESAMSEVAMAYLDHVREHLKCRDLSLDGRRLAMMYRAVLGLVALHRAAGRLPARLDGPPVDLFRHALDLTLPFCALGQDVPQMVLDAAHRHAVAAIQGQRRPVVVGQHFLELVRGLVTGDEAWRDRAASALLVTRLTNAVERPSRVETAVEAAAALVHLMARPEVHDRLSADARHRLWCCWQDLTSLEPDQAGEFADKSAALEYADDLPDRARQAVRRLAFRMAERLDRLPSVHCSFEDVAPKLIEAVVEGGMT